MLILPIGEGDGRIQRDALVCYGIIALNILVFVLVAVTNADERELMRTWRSTVTYLDDRPYLQTPRVVLDLMPQHLRDRTVKPLDPIRDWRAAREQDVANESAARLHSLYSESSRMQFAFIPAIGSLRTLFTSMFVHSGLLHLAGNMFFLFATGPLIEKSFGKALFTLLYFGGGALATLALQWRFPESMTPLVGASGAIAVVMGAYLIEFWRSRLRLLFIPIIVLPMWNFRFSAPAAVLLSLWFLEQIVSIPMEAARGGVAFTVHAAGFALGATFALSRKAVLRLAKPQTGSVAPQRTAPAAAAGAPQSLTPALARAYENAKSRGDWRAADEVACRLLKLAENNDREAVLLTETIRVDEEAILPRFLAHSAAAAEKSGDRATAMRILLQIAENGSASADGVHALLNLARLRRLEGDEAGAKEAFKRVLLHVHCTGEIRQRVYGALSGA